MYHLAQEHVNKNSSSSITKEYEQSDNGDRDSDLREVHSNSGEEDLEDSNCLKLPHYLLKEKVKGKNDFSIKDVNEEEAEDFDCDSDIGSFHAKLSRFGLFPP
eukprot:10636500-Ditylum_brightwellii.AAC.2